MFVDRRLPIDRGPPPHCRAEMQAITSILRTLANLYIANPTGECIRPYSLLTL
jgi:hypothetical protein